METSTRYYQVDRREISFIKFVLDAYDNMAVLSTVDPHQGIVRIRIAPGCEALVEGIVSGLVETIQRLKSDGFSTIGKDVSPSE